MKFEKVIAIASDHAGFNLKQEVKKHLDELGVAYKDYGTYENKSCNYPDYAEALCRGIQAGDSDLGILVCGTGVGMSMAANKIKGIRAACVSDCFSAEATRAHNDANIVCFGQRVVGEGLAFKIVDTFLDTPFEGGRHQIRIDMVNDLDNK